jgi:amino acid transporter
MVSTAAMAKQRSVLTLGPLVAVMFFTVSGGPFGLEGLVGRVGPGVAIALLLLTPLLYSVPEALIIGELASMLPAEGGYYQWVKRAFGRFAGFSNGWLSWMYSLIDMAIYPVLFLQYLRFFTGDLGRVPSWLLALALIWGATWLNLRGTRAVGLASGWFVAAVLAPFAVLAGFALYKWITIGSVGAFPAAPFHAVGAAGGSFVGALGLGISQSIWNYSGWDNASTVGGEIEESGRTYPRALLRTVPLVTLVYLAAIIPALAVTDWRTWTDGAWPAISGSVAGRWLAAWIAAAGMVSAFALFNALLLTYSRVPLVLARDGLLPGALAATDERGTPRRAVLVSAVAYSVFALLSFGGLLAADVLLYTAALALEFAALIRLRRSEPDLRGSFRVPVGENVLTLLATLPVLVLVSAVVLEVHSRAIGLVGVLVAALFAALGPIWYVGRSRMETRSGKIPA